MAPRQVFVFRVSDPERGFVAPAEVRKLRDASDTKGKKLPNRLLFFNGCVEVRLKHGVYAYLAGDQSYHGFLWSRGVLPDLGTLGGSYSAAFWINNAGDAVGGTTLAGDQITLGTLFTHGRIVNLGTVGQDQCSLAFSNNASNQIVGASGTGPGCFFGPPNARAFLWENGGPMVDLNALVENPSDLTFWDPFYISDNGEIIGNAFLPNGDFHAVVLVPDGDCDSACEQRIAESRINPPAVRPATTSTMPRFGKPADWLRSPFGRRFPLPASPAGLSNK